MKSATIPVRADGLIDVPRIVQAREVRRFFPGLLDNREIRDKDFPALDKSKRVYLDTGATSQEPLTPRLRMLGLVTQYPRGSTHSENTEEARRAQGLYSGAKENVRAFFNASNYHIAFIPGNTTGVSNFLATRIPLEGALVLMTDMEHNSEIVSVRNFAARVGAEVMFVPVSRPDGRLDLDFLNNVVLANTGRRILLNLIHASNFTGVINPVKQIREMVGGKVHIYLDMAQSAGHIPIDLNDLGVDFAGLSSHKMYGPMGVGVLFVNKARGSDDLITNVVSGGGAVQVVSRMTTIYQRSPERFEPGTPDIEGAIEFGYALDYLRTIGMERIRAHDEALGAYLLGELQKIPGIELYGPRNFNSRTGVIAFNVGSVYLRNYEEVAKMLDSRGISVRDGCFCVHIGGNTLMGTTAEIERHALDLGSGRATNKMTGAVRFSVAFYNTLDEAHRAVLAVQKVAGEILGR